MNKENAVIKKMMRKDTRKIIANIKLPPIDDKKKDGAVKTILDIEPEFYSMVEGRPVRASKSISKYKQNIKEIALKRALQGFINDEILRINRETETEKNIYETALRNFDDCQNSFDKFLADDNNKTIAIMQTSDALARELSNQIEEHKQANYELASIKSKLQYIDETLQILMSFQNFLNKASPILWKEENQIILDVQYPEILTIDSNVFVKNDIDFVATKLSELPLPKLFFDMPEQLVSVFSQLEEQNLNYLLATEELNINKIKFLKALQRMKDIIAEDLVYIKKIIKNIESVIVSTEAQEGELKDIFRKILNYNFKSSIISKPALQVFNYVEFTFEYLFAKNETHLSTVEMVKTIENEYDHLMMDLSVFGLKDVKLLEVETYEKGIEDLKKAKIASKLLKDVDKLNKRLKSSYELSKRNV